MKPNEEKSREEILAERELRKAAKLKAKQDRVSKVLKKNVDESTDTAQPVAKTEIKIANSSEKSAESITPTTVSSVLSKANNKKSVSFSEECVKTKAELKSERREKQEAQRALKLLKTADNAPKPLQPAIDKKTVEKSDPVTLKTSPKHQTSAPLHRIKLFSHLYHGKEFDDSRHIYALRPDIHPAVVKLGVKYKEKIIIGSNARCVAFIRTLIQVIMDYKTPVDKDFSRGLEQKFSGIASFLNDSRPFSVSMTNAFKHIKWHLTQLPNSISDAEAQNKLNEALNTYVRDQIDKAGEAIAMTVQKKIAENEIILTYGFSSLILRILVESQKSGKLFEVIVVDAGPLYEGKELLRRLVRAGLKCTYVLLTAASFIMRRATKVLLGAHAILTNGYVMSRAGSSQVALMANCYNVPVLICCETHKFSERVQTDAFVYNEIGDPDMMMSKSKWQSNSYLTPLSLMYDVTSPDLVTAVVTELAILPCTSVPVVLRVKPAESNL